MAYPLANFHAAMRAVLGDSGSALTGYDYHEEQLNGAIAAIVNMGMVPCVEMAPGAASLVEAPVNRATWGFIVAKAAHILVGGSSPESFRTRALSVTVEAAARRDTLSHLEAMLSEFEAAGNVCGTADDETYKGLIEMETDLITRSVRFFGCHRPHHHP